MSLDASSDGGLFAVGLMDGRVKAWAEEGSIPTVSARPHKAAVTQVTTPNPKPSTLNPQLSTLNPQPSTLNPQPSTLNPQPSTRNPGRWSCELRSGC